ncbi:MAG TPA: hypothetical protein DCP90_04970 [Clostridiales bacterium]|nr:MAG: hypothetical protein A2Y22_06295 [Clostridiales bacterium GWD2_32_59]HAN09950.1 hypothetical protein [Clostridiales bacterium]
MQGNMGLNNIIAVSLFFILLPFIMLFMEQTNSKLKIFLAIAIYVGIIAMFYTEFIYTTPIGDWIKEIEKALLGG